MAGNYPDVTSWRMAYDVDGTQVHQYRPDVGFVSFSPEQIANANNETTAPALPVTSSGAYMESYVVFIFPELRDVDGWFILGNEEGIQTTRFSVGSIYVSSDTTNGADGTWTLLGPNGPRRLSKESLRKDISWSTALGVKGIRVGHHWWNPGYASSGNLWIAHFYGEPAPNENPQRLEIWHPTLDQRLGPAYLDWGDVPRNSTETREFRVKNLHPTLTANNVRVAMSILTDTTPSVLGQQAVSKNGVTWAAQQMLDAPLGPEEISPVMQVRRQTPSNATLSLWWYRLFADSTSWTEEA